MSSAPLRTVTRTQGNNRALKDGTVKPDGVELDFVEVPVLVDGFRRMVRGLEFDVCEMAVTTYLCAKAHGVRFTALPVFLVRGFHHGAILRTTTSPIQAPGDLAGRRVGVNRGYTVTTGVWARGILQQEYGLDLDGVTWVLSGDEHVAQYRPPANVVAAPRGASLADLLLAGDLAATVGADIDHPDVTTLIPDADAAGYAALQRTGHYPINHLIVVRDDVLAAQPGVAEALFGAFAASKQRYLNSLRAIDSPTATDRMYQRVLELTGADPLPYGIEANRAVLEELIEHAVRQHILGERPEIDELFADGTQKLEG